LKSEYIFVNGKRAARIDLANNSVHYYLSDHLNSTSMVISSAGVVEDEADYSAFGTEYPVTSSGGNHYKFTGKERDTESGLDYFGARYYSNAFGRFLTPDWADKATAVPYANFGDPQTLNLYGYVRNVPTSLVDGDGHGFVNEAFQDWGFDLGVPGWGTGNSQAASAQGGGQQQQQQQGNQNQAAQNNPAVQNLVDAQNGAMANGKYAPNTPTAGTTHCSEAACSIAQRTGMNTTGILSDAKGHNYDANTQINNLANPKNGYHQVTPKEAQALANKGVVVFATQHGTHHGHIVTVRPEGVPGDHPRGRSGPLLANVGLFNGVAHQSAVFNPAHGVITYYAPTH
jgi:RHS repeat-associated protein